MRSLAPNPFIVLAAVTASLGSAPLSAQPQAEARFLFDLPAQALSDAIRKVAIQSGANVAADADLLQGRQAPALQGEFTAKEALARLIGGSGLAIAEVDGTLIVRRSESGGERFSGDDIVVTGSHVRGGQPTSPIITISRRSIDESGATSVEALMRQLPQNSQGGVNQENFAAPGAGADITEHGAGLNLRGLGQRATLVLVNGRRLAPSGVGSFIDVSLIPVSAVERVEVLTDGASAIYGSDAVGGVVNFILKDRFEGVETLLQGGATTKGGGEQFLAGVTGGSMWKGGGALLAYEHRREDEIRAGDRSFTINLNPDYFILPRERRHSLYGRAHQSLGPSLAVGLSGTFADRRTRRTYFFASSPVAVGATAEARSVGANASLGYDISTSWRAELDAGYFRSKTSQTQDQPGGQGLVNHLDTRNAVLDIGLKLDGDLFSLPGGAAKLAVGGAIRRERYRDLFETGVNAPAVRRDSRTIRSLFAEFQLPIVSAANRMPGLERLILTAAARRDDYGDYKPSFDPKLGILYSPVPGLAFRASYNRSFRAPLLSETTGFYNGFYLAEQFVYADPAQAGDGVALALVGSNPSIKPETSRSWTIGAQLEPKALPGLRLDLGFYDIRFSNRIVLPTPLIAIVGNAALEPIVTRDPETGAVSAITNGAAQLLDFSGPGFSNGGATPGDVTIIVDARFNNSAETRTRGIDAILHYEFEAGDHRFGVDVNASHILKFTDRLTTASPAIELVNTPYHPLDWRLRGGLSWSRMGWSASIFANHAGAYRDNRRPEERKVDAFTNFDAYFAWNGSPAGRGPLEGLRIAVSALNLFDARPPRLVLDPGTTRGLGYDPVNASGRGQSLSLQLTKSW